jgi:hypothetical protein
MPFGLTRAPHTF